MIKVSFSEIRGRTCVQVVSCQASRPDRSANQRLVFWRGNHLNSCPDSDLRKTVFSNCIAYRITWKSFQINDGVCSITIVGIDNEIP